MAGSKKLEVAIVLNAMDNMSGPAAAAVSKTQSSINGLRGSNLSLGSAAAAAGTGYGILRAEMGFVDKYSEQQAAFTNNRIMQMDKMGHVNEAVYGQEVEYLKSLSSKYTGSITEYSNMMNVFNENRVGAADVMNGVGESAAKLAVTLGDLSPDTAALFMSRLKNDMGVATSDMSEMANMAYKIKHLGGTKTGEESVHELTEFYKGAGLAGQNMGMGGVLDAKEFGMLGAPFLGKGYSGAQVGETFRKMLATIRNPEKYEQLMETAHAAGVDFQFYDKNNKFLGINNFAKQLQKTAKLDPRARSGILEDMTGRQGKAGDFLEYIAGHADEIGKYSDQYDSLANLNDAFTEITKTLQFQNKVLHSNYDNMQGAFGKTMQADVAAIYRGLDSATLKMTEFAGTYPNITKLGLELAAAGGSLLIIRGAMSGIAMYSPMMRAALDTMAGSSVFGKFASLAASLLMVKTLMDKTETDAQTNKSDLFGRNAAFMDKKIEENKHDGGVGGFMGANWWRFRKAAMSAKVALPGNNRDDYNNTQDDLAAHYDTLDKRQDEYQAAKSTHKRDKYPKGSTEYWNHYYDEENLSRERSTMQQSWGLYTAPELNDMSKNTVGPPANGGNTIAPVYNFEKIEINGADADWERRFKQMLKDNTFDLVNIVNNANKRTGQLSYGN
jgi:hypothetical protein